MTTTAILDVADLHGYYGKSHVLQGVALTVGEGELVTLLGRNGAGKSTTLKAIAGVVTPRGGQVRFRGKDIAGQPPHRIAAQGLCLVPEHRGIFKLLTVEENLKLGARRDSPWQLADIYRIFPRLHERRRNGGANLSGGEQQMLAIGRALMARPRVLLLDEPSMGLAPIIVQEIFRILRTINAEGLTIFLVEQNVRQALKIAQHGYVLETGEIVLADSGKNLLGNPRVLEAYLGG